MAQLTVEDRIIKSRIHLLNFFPFFGQLAVRLRIKEMEALPTMGTNGRDLFYNKEFVSKLSDPQLLFVMAHEVLHCVYQHMWTRGSRDPRIWNYAADYVINLEISDCKVGEMPKCPDSGKVIGLLDEKYRGMHTEQVYDLLMQKRNEVLEKLKGMGFDVHMDPDGGNSDGGEEGMSEGELDQALRDAGMSAEEAMIAKEEMKKAVMDAAKVAQNMNGAGSIPGGVKRLIDSFKDTSMDWREELNASVKSSIKNDYTMSRPNRKTAAYGFCLPSMKHDTEIDVGIAVDNSGSISQDMLRDFLSEVHGIMSQFGQFTLKLWTFDTQVCNPQDYDTFNADELEDYEIVGGGGTCFVCNYKFMKEQNYKPDVFLMMTDGYPCGSWGDENYIENTIFLIHGSDSIVAPFGKTLYYRD